MPVPWNRPLVWHKNTLLSSFNITVRDPWWSWAPALHVKHADRTKQLLSVLPLRCFSLAMRHLFLVHYQRNNLGWGVLWGCLRTWTYSIQSPTEIALTVPCSTCFPARPTMALFKCHPIEPCGCQIRMGCLMFQAQKEVIKQSLGQWIPSNWQVHTWQRGSSFSRQRWCSVPEWKSFALPMQCIQQGLTSIVRSGSSDCRPRVMMALESRPVPHRQGNSYLRPKTKTKVIK